MATPGWCGCSAPASNRPAEMTAGRTWGRWATRSATRRRSIHGTTAFDPRDYGYRKLSDLVEAIGLFEIKRRNLIVLVRDKRST